MAKKFQPGGVVIVGGYVQGLGLLRAFARRGIEVIVVNDRKLDIARYSKYCKDYVVFKEIGDPENLPSFLIDFAKTKGLNNWIILPTGDSVVYTLSKNKSILEQYYKIPTPEWDIVNYAYNKKLTYQLAEKLGILIPKTYYPENIDDAIKISKNIEFPCILKPAVMHKLYDATKSKLLKVSNKNDLVESYKKLTQVIHPSEVLIQEIIGGLPANLFSFGSFISKERIGYIIANRKRQIPMDFGVGSTFVESANIVELKELSLRLLNEIGYYGFSEVEFVKDPRDEKYKLLEINPRSWKWITITNQSNFGLVPLVCNSQPGIGRTQELGNDPAKEFSRVKWIHFWQDLFVSLKEILKGNLSIGQYLETLRGKKEFAVASWDDPLPLLIEPFTYVWNMIKSWRKEMLI
jgi:D-aspartate ligase